MFHTANKGPSGSGIYTREGLLEVIDGLPLAIVVIDGNRRTASAT